MTMPVTLVTRMIPENLRYKHACQVTLDYCLKWLFFIYLEYFLRIK